MTDPDSGGKPTGRLLWAVILILLLVLVIGWFANPFGKVEQGQQAGPQQMSTDWAEEPTGEAVDVTLPKTEITNAPAEPAAGASPAVGPTG